MIFTCRNIFSSYVLTFIFYLTGNRTSVVLCFLHENVYILFRCVFITETSWLMSVIPIMYALENFIYWYLWYFISVINPSWWRWVGLLSPNLNINCHFDVHSSLRIDQFVLSVIHGIQNISDMKCWPSAIRKIWLPYRFYVYDYLH